MLKLKKIAITGGLASGKSTVCRIFQELGAFVVNADAIVHQLLDPATDLGQQIIQLFGPEILIESKISRSVIAKKVFKNLGQLEKLEKLLHPKVEQEIEKLYEKSLKMGKYTSFVVEVPLLLKYMESLYDYTIAVIADEGIARKRFEDAGFQEEEYDQRMKRQLTPNQKAKKANFSIQNNGSLEELKKQVMDLNNILNKANFA